MLMFNLHVIWGGIKFSRYNLCFLGMTSASFTILWMKIKLEYNSIFFCGLGATVGIILGKLIKKKIIIII